MEEQFSRTEGLLGEEAVAHLHGCHVAVFGVGGVGGFVAEALARTGIGAIDLIDKDTVVIIDEAKRVHELAILMETEFNERFKSLFDGGEVFSFAEKNFNGVEHLTEKLKKYRTIALQALSTAIPFFNPLKIINP